MKRHFDKINNLYSDLVIKMEGKFSNRLKKKKLYLKQKVYVLVNKGDTGRISVKISSKIRMLDNTSIQYPSVNCS